MSKKKFTISDWNDDSHASKYTSAFPEGMLEKIIDWIYDDLDTSTFPRIERMKTAETDFGLPALGGITKELEVLSFIEEYFKTHTVDESRRFRQGIGVLVKCIMETAGWEKLGKKGRLGRRNTSIKPGKPYNTSRSFSKYFTQAERYGRKG